jgi:hypothetical protein
VISFAGAYSSWGATYAATDASGIEHTYFVTFSSTGTVEHAPTRVADEARVVPYGYPVAPSEQEPNILGRAGLADAVGGRRPKTSTSEVTSTDPRRAC